jgi:DNA polymerase-3 subunit alpha
MPFVPLRVHTTFSFLDGACAPGALAKHAKAMGFDALGIADSGHTAGFAPWAKSAKGVGLRPIFGVVVWTPPVFHLSGIEGEVRDGGQPFLLLVRNAGGHRALCRWLTASFADVQLRPRIPMAALLEGDPGLHLVVLPEAIDPLDDGTLGALAKIWGDRLDIGLADHGRPGDGERDGRQRDLAQRLGLPLVAVPDVRVLRSTDTPALMALRAISASAHVDVDGPWRVLTDQQHLPTDLEAGDLYGPEAVDRSGVIAQGLAFTPGSKKNFFPRSDPPETCVDDPSRWRWLREWFPPPRCMALLGAIEDITEGDAARWPVISRWFAALARRGLEVRLAEDSNRDRVGYSERLEFELASIHEMGFAAYLLIVAEFINWAKDAGIPVGPGRGSVAGSMAAWALRIHEVDPIRFRLLFERFLNPSRVSLPDIDVDFARARREEVIAHVRDRYGEDKVGFIANWMAFGVKSAIKDAARVLNVRFDVADGWTRGLDALETVRAVLDEKRSRMRYDIDPVFRRALKLAATLHGEDPGAFPSVHGDAEKAVMAGKTPKPEPWMRQRGVHAAGVVMTPEPLVAYAPVLPDGDRRVLDLDMAGVEAFGLVKFDFLGLKTLDVVEETLCHLERAGIERPDVNRIPLDDGAVFDALCAGDTLGLFQLEGAAMTAIVRRLQPRTIDDLIALVALFRPGPLQSGMVDDYIERRHGRAEVEDLHPSLKPVFADTWGVPVYQEQVMEMARVLCGFTLAEADLLRRAIGKKKPEELAAQKAKFIDGAVANGVDGGVAGGIFAKIEGFADYCFNRSHSASYGLISYITAWLKVHHRAAFLAAACTLAADDHAFVAAYLRDARKGGLVVVPPDIHWSADRFRVDDGGAVVYGLAAIKRVGPNAAAEIMRARSEGGRFKDLEDLCARVKRGVVNARALDALADAGALDDLCGDRIKARAAVEAVRRTKRKVKEAAGEVDKEALGPDVEADDIARETAVLGLALSAHPLERYGVFAARLAERRLDQLGDLGHRQPVRVAAVVERVQVVITRRQERIGYALLSDKAAALEVTIPASLFTATEALWRTGTALLVVGAFDSPVAGRFIVAKAEDLDAVRARGTRCVWIRPGEVDFGVIATAVSAWPGKCAVRVEGVSVGDPVARITPVREAFRALERLLGHKAVRAV